MDIKQLRTFVVVAKERNFTRAAEILNYSQSSVSGQIQALEHELGVPLFDRLGRGVILTEEGRKILVFVEDISRIEEQIRGIARGHDQPFGTVIVGASESIIAYRLPKILHRFRDRYPQVQLKFLPGACSDLRHALEIGEIDVALLLESPVQTDGLETECLVEEQIVLVTAPSHPLTEIQEIQEPDLAAQLLLLVETTRGGWSYRDIFQNQMAKYHVYPSQCIEFSSIEAIKQSAISGIGVALLPKITVQDELKEGKLVQLNWPPILLPTNLVWNKQRWISSAVQAFTTTVRDTVRT